MTEAKKNRILKKIEKYKKEMRYEKAKFGGYHDGRGYRYAIAELYFELKDYQKTNRYLNWFDKIFSDDGKFSYFQLGEAVTKFELGKIKEAKIDTVTINRHNTYLLDLLIENEVKDQDKYEWRASEKLEWAKEELVVHLDLVSESYLDWLKEFTAEESYREFYNKLISIKKLLVGMDVSEERSQLLRAQSACIKEWTSLV